jgi:hypothetical protein
VATLPVASGRPEFVVISWEVEGQLFTHVLRRVCRSESLEAASVGLN